MIEVTRAILLAEQCVPFGLPFGIIEPDCQNNAQLNFGALMFNKVLID